MRALLLMLLAATACTPDIVPGSYYCGPNASCPEDQVCSEATNTCGLRGLAEPFACDPELASEPDDTAATAYTLTTSDCITLPVVIEACMPSDDSADWLRFTAPAGCAALAVEVRITFPIAFQRLGIELVDLATNDVIATDTTCSFQGESGDDLRCATATIQSGASYGIKIAPTGEGDCGGRCAFNSYSVTVQLGAPD